MNLMLKMKNWDFWNDLGKVKSIMITEDTVTSLLDIREIDKRIYEVMLGTGVFYQIGGEYLYVFGGRCKSQEVSLRLEDETNFFNLGNTFVAVCSIPFPLDDIDMINLEFEKQIK